MTPDELLIRGAQEHNLKNIDVTLPRFKLIVITGVSGSGKSSLAFDTLYAEGQRRYVESLSAYARQFIGQMEKPRVDFIGGLSPAIAIELVVDRLVVPDGNEQARDQYITRLTDTIETALRAGEGLVIIDRLDDDEWLLSEQNACPSCGLSFPELTPAMFSFNSPMGMCPECNGLGRKIEFDPDRFVDPDRSLHDGGVRTWGELKKKKRSGTYQVARQLVERFGFDLDTPWRDLSEECRQAILYGGVRIVWESSSECSSWRGEWEYEGTVNATRRRYRQTKSDWTRRWYTSFMSQQPCASCHGERLRPESLAVTFGGKRITEVTTESIGGALAWLEELWPELPEDLLEIVGEVLREIRERLQFLMNVGLHYLTLDRPARTLSGGEGQRIRLASQIGCGLVGVLYVLDEPSIGLHPRDNRRALR